MIKYNVRIKRIFSYRQDLDVLFCVHMSRQENVKKKKAKKNRHQCKHVYTFVFLQLKHQMSTSAAIVLAICGGEHALITFSMFHLSSGALQTSCHSPFIPNRT